MAIDQSLGMWALLSVAGAFLLRFVGYPGVRDLWKCLQIRRNKPVLLISLQDPVFSEAKTDNGVVRFYHLRVHNMGTTDATNCQARLMGVWSMPGGEIILGAGDVPLQWAHQPLGPESLLVRGQEDVELDLLTQSQGNPGHLRVFGTRKEPDGLRKEYGPGEYYLKIRLTADNASSCDLRLTVKHAGSWEQPAELTRAGNQAVQTGVDTRPGKSAR